MTGFWDAYGTDEGLLPTHLPMELTRDHQGPAEVEEWHHMGCWCGQPGCPLSKALHLTWLMGQASTFHLIVDEAKPGVAEALRKAAEGMAVHPSAQAFLLQHADRLDPQ